MPSRSTDMIRNMYQLRAVLQEMKMLDGVGESFTAKDPADPDGIGYLFLIALIREWCDRKGWDKSSIVIDPDTMTNIMMQFQITPEAANEAHTRRLAQGKENEPILIVLMGENMRIIDGNHRIVYTGIKATLAKGDGRIDAYIVKMEDMLRMGFCRRMSAKLFDLSEGQFPDKPEGEEENADAG